MEMKRNVVIKTVETQLFFKITVGGKTNLFDAAMRKIAILQNMAKYEKNIYSFLYLIDIHEKINLLLKNTDKKVKHYEHLCKKQINDLSTIKFPTKETREYGFSNPVSFDLIQLLQKFDDCNALILLAKNLSIFTDQKMFYNLKNQLRKECFAVFHDIIRIKTRAIEKVTITHYLKNDETYQAAVTRVGETDPQTLYNAISSSITPLVSETELNQIVSGLKEKAMQAAQ
jgi:hypothetical protein